MSWIGGWLVSFLQQLWKNLQQKPINSCSTRNRPIKSSTAALATDEETSADVSFPLFQPSSPPQHTPASKVSLYINYNFVILPYFADEYCMHFDSVFRQ